MPDIGSTLELGEIIDVPRIQEMMDSFYKLARITMAIVDRNGKVLVGVGWEDICTKFHRISPLSCKYCIESDTQLTQGIPKGQFKLYKCKNNMWDMASPIYVGDRHMGCIFIGQFFFDDEKLDYKLFRSQAKNYGFDEKEYIKAVKKVPRINRELLNAAKQFLIDFAKNISQLSYTNIKLACALEEQRKIQEALQSNEANLLTIMDAAKESIWLLTPDGVAIMGNQTAVERFGNQKVIGRYLGDFTPPEVHKVRIAYFKKAVESGKVVEFDDHIDNVIYRTNLYPVKDEYNRVTAIVAFARDITESKKAEKLLIDSEERLNFALETFHTGAWDLDLVNHTAFCSVEHARIFGYTGPLPEWTYEKFLEHVLPEDRKAVDEIFKRAVATDTDCRFECRIKRLDGQIRWILAAGRYRLNLPCNARKMAGIVQDITERKNAEIALQQSHNDLEKRVVERTAALAETVKRLEAEIRLRTYAEGKARTERKRFEDVLDMLPAHAVLLTPDCHIVYANKFFEKRFGKHNGKKCYELIFGRTEPCENCQTLHILQTQKSVFWEWTAPDGRSYDIYDYPFKDTDGSPLIMEIGLDVTAHKQAMKSLKSNSLYIRGLIEVDVDPMFIIDLKGNITDANKAAENATGVEREKLIGSDFSKYFTEPQKARQGYEIVLAEGQVKDYPLDILNKSGKIISLMYNAKVYRDQAGNVQGVFVSARDITERKAVEERQNFTNAMLELFARNSTRKEYLDAAIEVFCQWSRCAFAGIRIKDGQGNIPYESYVGFDNEFLKLENFLHTHIDKCICTRAITNSATEYEKGYLTAGNSFFCNDTSDFLKALSPQDKKNYRGTCIKCGFRSLAAIPIYYQKEALGLIHIADLKKDMVPFSKIEFIETTISVMLGEAVHRFNAEAELDEYRRRLEEKVKLRTQELARSNRDLEQFAYVASHDLQEPLRAVAGFVELLKSRLTDSLEEESLKYMNFAVDGVHRMQSLIQGLLEYSRVGSHSKALAMIDAERPLKYAMEHLKIAIDESGTKITADDLPTVKIDEVQFMQLFQNLIGNAIKFKSDKNPHVHIAAEKNDGFWQFSVRDNGVGIEQEYAERIFLIFQRLHTREKYPGTGIGLSICKKIVERHGGKIWVESQPGRGSTFYFTVPEIGVS